MTDQQQKKSKVSGLLVGGLLMGGAILAVIFLDLRPKPPEEEAEIRPLKTLVVSSATQVSGRAYPGRVKANREVNLAFEVPGRITKILVKKSDQVKQGDVLARLDDSDYQNDLKSAEAEMDRAKAQKDRVEKAAESNAVSQQDVSDARAAYNSALAQVNIRKKAVDDTTLRATFPGLIANRFVDTFQDVQSKEPILSLQDVAILEIEVNIPEERIIRGRDGNMELKFIATFEYLPGQEFPVKIKELATEADPATQTFLARFTMVPPDREKGVILPGMTATIREEFQESTPTADSVDDSFSIPIDVAGIDGLGTYFVWVLTDEGDGLYAAHRSDIEVGEMSGDQIRVLSGINNGDRIAAAGISFLQEGQVVRLLDENTLGAQL